MSKQDEIKMLIEEVLVDGKITKGWREYTPEGPAKEYIKGAISNYQNGKWPGERLLSVKLNGQDYWDLDSSTKNPPPKDKPRSNELW